MKDDWYCYLCGKPIGNSFILWSLNDRIDRVFLAHDNPECYEQLGEDTIIVTVGRIHKE